VGGAAEDAEEFLPGADGVEVLVCEGAGDLVEVSEIVDGPGGEELRKRDDAELGMCAAAIEIGGLKVEGIEGAEIFGAKACEFVEELWEGFAEAVFLLSEAVKGDERFGFAVFEDHASAGNPVGEFAANKVADDVVGRPGLGAFVWLGPGVGEIAEERAESGGSAGEKRNGVGKIKVHDASLYVVNWEFEIRRRRD
jgi:hypothetical protein